MKKRIKQSAVALTIAFCMLFLFACPVIVPPPPNPIENVTFVMETVQTHYYFGQTFSLTGTRVRVEFNDEREEDVIYLYYGDPRLTFLPSAIDTTIPRANIPLRVTFTEGEFSRFAEIPITVLPQDTNPVSNIEFVDFDLYFDQGDSISAADFNGVTVRVNFADDERDSILATFPQDSRLALNFSSINTSVAGWHPLIATFTYRAFPNTASINVEVRSDTVNPIAGLEFVDPPTMFVRNTTVDLTGVEIRILYSDNTNRIIEYPYTGLSFNTINTSVLGPQPLTATFLYEGFNNSVTTFITIVREFSIVSFALPGFLNLYHQNISRVGTLENDFKLRDEGYYIGTNNPFSFFPIIQELDLTAIGGVRTITVGNYAPLINVYQYQSVGASYEWVNLTGAERDTYITIIPALGSFQFHEAAIDAGPFRITQQIANPEHLANPDNILAFPALVLDNITVIDAMNVTEVGGIFGLGMLDNRSLHPIYTNIPPREAWIDERGADNNDLNGIILHNNINITRNNLPDVLFNASGHLIQEATATSLFYRVHDNPDQPFNFIGNYFSIDASNLPLVHDDATSDRSPTGFVMSHMSLFFMSALNDSEINIRNLSSLGNVQRSDQEEDSRGARFAYVRGDVDVSNIILRGHFAHFQIYSTSEQYGMLTISDSRMYDSWSNSIYSWNGHATVYRSDVRRSGGPLIVLGNFWGVQGIYTSEIYPQIHFIDSTVENFVQPTAPWFLVYGVAHLLNDFNVMDLELINDWGKTVFAPTSASGIVQDTLNFIGAIRVEGNNIPDNFNVRGILSFDGEAILDMGGHTTNEFESIIAPGMVPLPQPPFPVNDLRLGWNVGAIPLFNAGGVRFLPGGLVINPMFNPEYAMGLPGGDQHPLFDFFMNPVIPVNDWSMTQTGITGELVNTDQAIRDSEKIGIYFRAPGLGTLGLAFKFYDFEA
ncbi:MAG: hypothetical protein FWE22_03060 [Firmicutes bacterium]|nr:hypothetical protein [Bacillota bacterium]